MKSGLASNDIALDLHQQGFERPIRKISSLRLPVKAEATAGSAISSDGSLFLTCIDPSFLLVFDLKKGSLARQLQLTLPAGGGGRRVTMDSCEISVSRDDRFGAVSVRGDNGVRSLTLVALGQEGPPAFSTEGYQFGVFVGDYLVAAKANVLKAVTIGKWTDDIPVVGPIMPLIDSIASEADGSVFGTAALGGFRLYHFDLAKRSFVQNVQFLSIGQTLGHMDSDCGLLCVGASLRQRCLSAVPVWCTSRYAYVAVHVSGCRRTQHSSAYL